MRTIRFRQWWERTLSWLQLADTAAAAAAVDVQPILWLYFQLWSTMAFWSNTQKVHIMCITITLLCRITYDNKMTVRKHNVERNWRKIYMEKERENSTTSATIYSLVNVKVYSSKWAKELTGRNRINRWKWKSMKSDFVCQNKIGMKWTSSTVCVSQRIGQNDITTIRIFINKSRVILGQIHIKTSTFMDVGRSKNY